MKAYQLKAMYIKHGDLTEAPTRAEADLFSIYKGEPGNFEWLADFSDPDLAYAHAVKWQAETKGKYRLDTTQFDAVMNPKPKPTFPEGFIKWHGGECPVDPNTDVQVILRQDARNHPDMVRPARNWAWPHHNWASDIVAYKVVEEAKPAKPIGHPHAELMAQYAEDAKSNSEPWTLWQWRQESSKPRDWETCTDHPNWYCHLEFHRKPAPAAPSGDPTHCPFCGGNDVVFANGDTFRSESSPDVLLTIDEHQCRSESCGRSFWS